jgi:hypothetical protein
LCACWLLLCLCWLCCCWLCWRRLLLGLRLLLLLLGLCMAVSQGLLCCFCNSSITAV